MRVFGFPVPAARSGVTLIELLFVLVVLGILLALAAPSLHAHVGRARMNATLEALRGDINYARAVAVRAGDRVEVRFDPNQKHACVTRYAVVVLAAQERVVKNVELGSAAAGVCLSHNQEPGNRLVFNSRGVPRGVVGRTFRVQRGAMTDSMKLSSLGRLVRFD
jgi:prepilin-type N-terminal cleavage/methylation domain-containing protein